MAKLLTISSRMISLLHRNVGDIVSVLNDNHFVSEDALKLYNVSYIKGSKIEIETKLRAQLKEEKAIVFKSKSTGRWSLDEPMRDDLETEERAWKNPVNNKWYFLERKRKFSYSLTDLTAAERTVIEDTLPNQLSAEKDAVYKKMCKQDLSAFFENGVEVPDLSVQVIG